MKYSSRGRPILLGNSKAWARAGPSSSAEASRATKKAKFPADEDRTLGNAERLPRVSDRLAVMQLDRSKDGVAAMRDQRAVLYEMQPRRRAAMPQGFQRRKLAI